MDAVKDLKWFVFIVIVLWVLWYITGGPSHFESVNKPFIKPAAPIDTGEVY